MSHPLTQKQLRKTTTLYEQNAVSWVITVSSELKSFIKSNCQRYFGPYCVNGFVKSIKAVDKKSLYFKKKIKFA